MNKHLLAAALLAALPLAASADPPPPPPDGWSGTGEAGLAIASGNTKSENVNAKLDVKYNDDTWKDDFYLLAQRNKSNITDASGNTNYELTANRYEGGASLGFKFDDRSYLVSALRYEHDDFAPYDYQYTLSLGYGYQFLKNSRDELAAEVGPGYNVVQSTALLVETGNPPAPVLVKPDSDKSLVLRGKIDYKHNFNASTSFVDTFTVEAGSDNKFYQNDAGIAVKMSDKLSLKAAYQVRHNTVVGEGFKKTDNLLTTNLVYGF
jgi:putative salt-induced outer membrane protein